MNWSTQICIISSILQQRPPTKCSSQDNQPTRTRSAAHTPSSYLVCPTLICRRHTFSIWPTERISTWSSLKASQPFAFEYKHGKAESCRSVRRSLGLQKYCLAREHRIMAPHCGRTTTQCCKTCPTTLILLKHLWGGRSLLWCFSSPAQQRRIPLK